MINYITQLFRNRELDSILKEISGQYPELDEHQGETRIEFYLSLAVQHYAESRKVYEDAPDKSILDEPVMSALLVRTIRYWTTHPATTYSYLLLQKAIEISQLREQVAVQQQVEEFRQKQEGLVLQLADVANKAIQDVNESVLPSRRMN